MSSFPGDTQEETRLVGGRGVHDAGTHASTAPPTLQASKPSLSWPTARAAF